MVMGRCVYCHSVVIKGENQCYVCGDVVPERVRTRTLAKTRPTTGWTNLLFVASLGFTIYCWLATDRFSLPVTIAISSGLLGLRILAEYFARHRSN
jgi:hypothetical protein